MSRTSGITGEFVDPDDCAAMERWARDLCRGLDVRETAKELQTAPTISAVADRLVGRSTDNQSIRTMVIRSCEEELKAANPDL